MRGPTGGASRDDAAAHHLPLIESAQQVRLLAMTAMAATLAHDLVQPLTAAINYLHATSSLLKGMEGTADSLAMIERACTQTMKAVEIIRRMRSFAVDGKVNGTRQSLRQMIVRVRADLLIHDRLDTELIILIGRDANCVVGDRIQLELVLTNLLANAADAVKDRSFRRVEIDSRRKGDEIEVRVCDSGPGLTDETHARLFDPLFTTKARGAGLGLPICKAIVEAHGGRLWADAHSRHGTVFHMTLPAAACAEQEDMDGDNE